MPLMPEMLVCHSSRCQLQAHAVTAQSRDAHLSFATLPQSSQSLALRTHVRLKFQDGRRNRSAICMRHVIVFLTLSRGFSGPSLRIRKSVATDSF